MKPYVTGLRRGEPPVVQRIGEDAVDVLTGVSCDDAEHGIAGMSQVVGLDFHLDCRAGDARRALVHQDAGVWEREPLARRPGRQ